MNRALWPTELCALGAAKYSNYGIDAPSSLGRLWLRAVILPGHLFFGCEAADSVVTPVIQRSSWDPQADHSPRPRWRGGVTPLTPSPGHPCHRPQAHLSPQERNTVKVYSRNYADRDSVLALCHSRDLARNYTRPYDRLPALATALRITHPRHRRRRRHARRPASSIPSANRKTA